MAVFATAFVRCARIAGITGGPKDTLPPILMKVSPNSNTLNFDDKHIYFEFDEYVALKDLQREFYTSPKMNKIPTVTLRGRGFRVDILDDTLKENRTYSLNWGSSVTDNHEGNPLNGFRYVFSTGGEIDSLVMSGYTEDAQRGDSVSKAFVWFYDAALRSDSLIFNEEPEAIGRAENNGIFIARNLKPKDYVVYAFEDVNNNQIYDAGTDKIGFLDSVYNPARMREFEAWYDTTRHYVVARPQLYFRMFTDERPSRQVLVDPRRPQQHKVMMSFAAPWPKIERLSFDSIPSERVITEYLRSTRDSMALWLNVPSEQLPDTLKGEIVYMRPDSMGVEAPFRQELKLAWRKVESSAERRERERREKDIEQGREVEPEINPFNYTITRGEINPTKGIEMTFGIPLSSVDEQAMRLSVGDSTNMRQVRMRMTRDSVEVRKWHLAAPWRAGERYRLLIPSGALRNVAGEVNDSIVMAYDIRPESEVSTIIVDIAGKSPESEYIVQLTDESGSGILDERTHVRSGRIRFAYVTPGKVRLKITEDDNGNGEWNTGNLLLGAQPERVEFYVEKGDEPTFTVRAGWEEVKVLDMSKIFAPITIESVWEKLRVEEEARLEKLREYLTKFYDDRRRREEQGVGGQSAGSMLQGATGLNLPGF